MLVPSIVFAYTNVQTKICNPFDAPSITAPASGSSTSDSSIHLVGRGEPGMVVSISKNGNGSGATTATGDGSYAINVPLDTGNNSLVASTINDCNTVKKSSALQALRTTAATPASSTTAEAVAAQNNTPAAVNQTLRSIEVAALTKMPAPAPTDTDTEEVSVEQQQAQKEIITEPKAGEVLTSERTWITGKTTPVTKVDIYVNQAVAASVVSADDGVYGAMVSIKPGKNTIQVQATRADGTVVTMRTIDVQLVNKNESGPSKQPSDAEELKDMQDTAGWIAIGAIGIGGACVMSFILWHTHELRVRRKK